LKNAHSSDNIRGFFARSDDLDRMTLRPLSHITLSWETQWDFENERYEPEYDSFTDDLNVVIEQLADCARPASYHLHEDQLAENTLRQLRWPIQKKKGRWIGADYATILEQGAFGEMPNLISAACERGGGGFGHGRDMR
jgi:hypothetical protein